MFRSIAITIAMILGLGTTSGFAQQADPTIPEEMQVKKLPRQKLAGPRFGFTVFTGQVAEYRQAQGLEPIMSQFGWQFETQMVSTTEGNQALMEWLILLGGLEQDETSVSLAWLAGYRLANGLEFGVGPNFNANFNESATNTSMIMAAGATLPFGQLYVPVNFAVSFSDGGPRITALLGWIVG
jgi:hypothetical protein